jgi:hypothetical protein
MIKSMAAIIDFYKKHGIMAKWILSATVFTILFGIYNFPGVHEAVLGVLGIGTHTQQVKVENRIIEIENIVKENNERELSRDKVIEELQHYQLMTIITNESLPISLRLDAYDKYTKMGYNSWVHLYYDNKLKLLSSDVMDYRLNKIKE